MNKSIDGQWHRKSFQRIKVTDTKLGHACLNLTNGISVGISLDGCIRIKSLNNNILVAYRPSQTDPHSYSLKSKCINIFASTDAVKLALSTSNTSIFTIETCNEQKVNGDQSLENSVNLNWASKTVLIENLIGENKTWHSKTSASLWRFDKALKAFLESANKDDLATQKRLMKSVRIKKISPENGEHFLQVQIFFERWIYNIRQNVSGVVIARMSSRTTRMPFMSIKVDPSDTVFSISTEKLKAFTLKHQLTSYETHLCRGCETFNEISLNSELVCLTSKNTHFLVTKPDNELRIYRMVFSSSDQFKRTNAPNSASECFSSESRNITDHPLNSITVNDESKITNEQTIIASIHPSSSNENRISTDKSALNVDDVNEINTGLNNTIDCTELGSYNDGDGKHLDKIISESFFIFPNGSEGRYLKKSANEQAETLDNSEKVTNPIMSENSFNKTASHVLVAGPEVLIGNNENLTNLKKRDNVDEYECDSGRGRSSWSSDDVCNGESVSAVTKNYTVAELKYIFEFSKFSQSEAADKSHRETKLAECSSGYVKQMKTIFESKRCELPIHKGNTHRVGTFVRAMIGLFS
ncbi:hypothetical protein ACOME3_003239 [Neoechinorhynchus agilis]